MQCGIRSNRTSTVLAGASSLFMFASGLFLCADVTRAEDQALAANHLATGVKGTQTAQIGIEVPTKVIRVRRGETVVDRKRPELDPLGIRAGTFLIFPSIVVDQSYNDNIFADESDQKSDFITEVRPGVGIRSDWNNHELRLDAGANIGRYWDHSSENFEDYYFRTSGRLDVRRDTNISAYAGYRASHESRSSPNDVRGKEPTEYDTTSLGLGGFQRFNRFNFRLGAAVNRIDFHDVPAAQGRIINNDDRDRDEFEGFVRGGYDISPRFGVFVRGAYNIRDYNDHVDDAGINRDSNGFEVVGGVDLDFGGITFGEFFAGYRSQKYDDPVLEDAQGPTIGGEITWNVTRLTTIIGNASRQIREATQRDSSGSFASGRFFTTVGIEAQHELLRNLLLGADLSYSQDDFQGINRTDEIYRAGINATYMLNRNFYISGGYAFRNRDSNEGSNGFTDNSVFIRIRAQY